MFLSLDGTALIQLLNFAVFFLLLSVLFLKPVGNAIRKRREYINSVTADYDAYQGEANSIRANAERVRAEARREAEQMLSKSRADASNKAADLAAEYGAKVQGIVEDAQAKVAAEMDVARAGEERLVRELSDEMVDRAVGGVR